MKKIVLLIIVVAVMVVLASTYLDVSIPNGEEKVEIFTSSAIIVSDSDCYKQSVLGMDIYETKEHDLNKNLKSHQNFIGVTYTYSNIDIESILNHLHGEIVKIEKIDNIVVYYAYSKKIGISKMVNGNNINIQISNNEGLVKVGIPLLVGSY